MSNTTDLNTIEYVLAQCMAIIMQVNS